MICTVRIDLLRKNLKKINQPFALMVKANAYGHGFDLIKKTADLVTCFGVATEEEGIRVRKLTDKPILVTAPNVRFARFISEYSLTPMVSNLAQLVAINEYAREVTKVHLKVDTGMGRFGVKSLVQTKTFLTIVDKLPNVKLSGICTHFSSKQNAQNQVNLFDKHVEVAERYSGRLLRHASASGTYLADKYDMRRIGYSAYSNVLKVTTSVASVKTLKKGECVGYNSIYQAKNKTKIAVVFGGYADGIPRNAVGYFVKIRDKKHKIVAVCMDVFMVELSCIVDVNDEVLVVNGLKDLETLSLITNKIPYELYVGFVGRCKFIYES